MKNFARFVWCIGLIFVISATFVFAGETESKTKKRGQGDYDIKVTAWGPTQADVDAASVRAEQSPAVRRVLDGTKHRLMSVEYLDNKAKTGEPTRFRVTFYDYTNDKTYFADGDFAGKEPITVSEQNFDPGVIEKELEEAYGIIQNDRAFASYFGNGQIALYEAMPPTSRVNGERLVNVGVRIEGQAGNRIVGVSFKNNTVVNYENNAPPTAVAPEGSCGIPNSNQGSTGTGLAGQYQLTVTDNGSPLWEMIVVRPSASSGYAFERSGVEIRDVKYKGKSVLKRGHAPILNVKYVDDVCGPFRDWQYSEGNFVAPDAGATDPAPGIRVLAPGQIATTAIETGNDNGNFRGVAIYRQNVGYGNEIVMVSEMNAGWYRYIMEWRFAPDGTIRPRYGFGSVVNGCVCAGRNHHVYWRFDFDVVNRNNKIYKVERGRKFLTPIKTETTMLRSYQTNRSLLIQNATGDEAYQLVPSLTDSQTDAFGGGDFWVMKFAGTPTNPDEIDDPGNGVAANLSPWINNESVDGEDLVVWYAAHQFRNDATSLTNFDRGGNIINGVHVVGPDLRPVRW